MRVAVYLRVSTTKQEADNQWLQIKPYCEKSGYEVYKVYTDVVTGSKDSRPQWDLMFKEAHQRKYDIVVFWSLDRFSRSGTLFTLQKLKELENLGIDWESYTEQYLKTTGQFKDVVISIIATLAKIEREKISERTKAGLAKARGNHIRNGVEKLGVGKRGCDKKPRKPRADRGFKRKGKLNEKYHPPNYKGGN